MIFDEIHYIDDPEREAFGKSLISCLLRCVSSIRATIPNVDELASWIEEVQNSSVEVVTHFERVALFDIPHGVRGLYDDERCAEEVS